MSFNQQLVSDLKFFNALLTATFNSLTEQLRVHQDN